MLRKFLLLMSVLSFAVTVFASAVAGNAQGKVTLVEFFDYQCPHCRNMAPIIDQLIKANPGLKVEYRVLPILGNDSVFEARASLAAAKQDKFAQYHELLMQQLGSPSSSDILAFAHQAGLNTHQFETDMNSDAVSEIIKNNFATAQQLQVQAVPTIYIGKTGGKPQYRYDGEVTLDTLQGAVQLLLEKQTS